jgi:glutathione S-transferase
LTDTFTDGKTINLFESGSIMQYLVERYDTEHKISFPKGSREAYEVNNWLFFMNAGVGPMQGQASKYFPSKISFAQIKWNNCYCWFPSHSHMRGRKLPVHSGTVKDPFAFASYE